MKGLVFYFSFLVQFASVDALDEYLGCFLDRIGQRDLNVFIGDYPQLTVEQCVRACQAEHHPFAAIQYGTECRCGHRYGLYGQVSDEQCSYRCSTKEICGGDYRNSVYRVILLSDTAVTCQKDLIGYQGCFPSETLSVVMGRVTSIDQCVQQCSTNYQYAGILDGHFCQCGNDLRQLALSSSLCRLSCDASETSLNNGCCGGRDVLSVYSVNYYQPPPATNDSPETVIRVKRADAVSGATSLISAGTSASSTVMTSVSTSSASTISITTASLPMSSTATGNSTSALPLASSITTSQFIPLTTPTTNYSPTSTPIGSSLSMSSTQITTSLINASSTPFTTLLSSTVSTPTFVTTSGSTHSLATLLTSTVSNPTFVITSASSPSPTTLLTSTVSNPTIVTTIGSTPSSATLLSSMVSNPTLVTTSASSPSFAPLLSSMVSYPTVVTTIGSTASLATLLSSMVSSPTFATATAGPTLGSSMSMGTGASAIGGTGSSNTMVTGSSATVGTGSSMSMGTGSSATAGTGSSGTAGTASSISMGTGSSMSMGTGSSMGSIPTQPSAQTVMSTVGSSGLTSTGQSTISGSMATHSLSSGISMFNTIMNLSPATIVSSPVSILTAQSSGTAFTSATQSTTMAPSLNNLTSSNIALTQTSPSIINPTSLTPTNSPTIVGVVTMSTATGNPTAASITVNSITTAGLSTGSFTSNTVTTTVSVVVPSAFIITTVFFVPTNVTFNPALNATRESIRQGLNNVINIAFICLSNPSSANCTQVSPRQKRQACSTGYLVHLASDITQLVSTTADGRYSVNYDVTDLCNPPNFISPNQVKTASASLTSARIAQIFGYQYEGDFIRSTTTATTAATPDRKLWLIGATLGPVAFVLLLIFVCCYLHYKCRPRTTNRPVMKANDPSAQESGRGRTYQNLNNDPGRDRYVSDKNVRVLAENDPLAGTHSATKRPIPKEFLKDPNSVAPIPVGTDIPMDEFQRQNEVERWRNKLRLQEKYQQTPLGHRVSAESNADGSMAPYDPLRINIQPAANVKLETPARPVSETMSIPAGRSKLHRLLDEVIDQAKSEDRYDPDSDRERLKRRQQRRRAYSNSDESHYSPIQHDPQQKPHIPVVAQVSERPDPQIVRLHYNPYEAGDRTHAISNLDPVELRPKFSYDDSNVPPRYSRSAYRSDPALYFDDSNIADRSATATDVYGSPKRRPRTLLESDREAAMRHDGGHVDRRSHVFQDDGVYVDSISKTRGPPRPGWVDPAPPNGDYRDEYLTAKRSVVNTRNIISSIHDELQNIVFPVSENYQA